MAKVLVTGGAGYVGSHACKALALEGHEPIVVDNLSRGHREFVNYGPFEFCDVLYTDGLEAVMRRHKPEVVVHFAALAYVRESFERTAEYYRLNVGGTASIAKAMRDSGVEKIVFSSSCATYGVQDSGVVSEAATQLPISPYGNSKLVAERVLLDCALETNLRWMALRYFNAAGADADLEVGEWHEPEPHVMPRLLRSVIHRDCRFEVLGNDYPTHDGSAVRDYVHVSDLARAHVAAVNYLLKGGDSCAINLGAERGMSVLELIEAASRVVGTPANYVVKPRRHGDPPIAIADSTLASKILGWKPQLSDVHQIIESAVRWHRKHPHTLKW